ncbi:MAG: hypothetical protein ABI480_02815 [Chitinophagaceae bacterium]
MATLFVLGDKLIPEKIYTEKVKNGDVAKLLTASRASKKASVDFADVTVHAADISVVTTNLKPLKEIGIGKPLSAEILCMYSGDFIHGGLFTPKKRDLLCVSGVRSTATFSGVSRALNKLQRKVKEKQYLEFSAPEDGTPFIYYTKAVDAETLLLTVEMNGDAFNDGLFNTISNLLGKAAGLPLFMPAAGYLLAGSQIA